MSVVNTNTNNSSLLQQLAQASRSDAAAALQTIIMPAGTPGCSDALLPFKGLRLIVLADNPSHN